MGYFVPLPCYEFYADGDNSRYHQEMERISNWVKENPDYELDVYRDGTYTTIGYRETIVITVKRKTE